MNLFHMYACVCRLGWVWGRDEQEERRDLMTEADDVTFR